MQVNRRFFPAIILDNEEVYFQHLCGIIEAVDELSSLEITKTPTELHFRIAPSLPKYSEMLLKEILKMHNIFQIRLDLSKSIKASAIINYSISINM